MSSPVALVGDIHGDIDRMRAMLTDKALTGRELVFLGDYVNRGPASREVIDELISLRRRHPEPTTFLVGNHDAALCEVLRGGPVAPLLLMGGGATVRSWVSDVVGDVAEALREAVSAEQRAFLFDLQDEWETTRVRATHSSLPAASDPRLHVVGHYIQADCEPRLADGVAYLDTGCGSRPGGRLSALLLPEVQFISR